MQYSDWTYHVFIVAYFLQKWCFSKFNMIKAEQGRMSLLIDQLGTKKKVDKRWIRLGEPDVLIKENNILFNQ